MARRANRRARIHRGGHLRSRRHPAVRLPRFRRVGRSADRPCQHEYSRLVRADEEPPQRHRKLRRRMMAATNSEFEFCGVNHLALVCKDMAKTVEFYRDQLGMPRSEEHTSELQSLM